MKLHEEIYFDITLSGQKSDVAQFARFIASGDLDDILEISPEHISYSDGYEIAAETDMARMTILNDDYGIEMDSFDPEEFLDVFCAAARKLDINGCFYDVDGKEYHFFSQMDEAYYTNARNMKFNDELDEEAYREEREANDYDY